MSDTANAIMDAAERRIRDAGYNGFSFREIAADVGVKSASVHYHFPTKEALAAAVARRYTDRFMSAIEQENVEGGAPADTWTRAFHRSLREDGKMCLCGALGATSKNLPDEVSQELRRFFRMGTEKMMEQGLPRPQAMQLLATLEGAMLLANVFGDNSAFDEAVAPLKG